MQVQTDRAFHKVWSNAKRRLTADLATDGEFKHAGVFRRREDAVELFRKYRWPRHLPRPTGLLNRGKRI